MGNHFADLCTRNAKPFYISCDTLYVHIMHSLKEQLSVQFHSVDVRTELLAIFQEYNCFFSVTFV